VRERVGTAGQRVLGRDRLGLDPGEQHGPSVGPRRNRVARHRPAGGRITTVPVTTREWQLAARPHGEPTPDDFRLVDTERPDPGDGQVVVRMLVMSVDPYMRGRMNAGKSYAARWELDEVMRGGAVGRVVVSRSTAVPEGALVLADAAWRDIAVLDAAHVRVLPELPGIPPSYHLGVLGMPGLTAYAGLFRIAGFQPGEDVFVSGAAGAVGSLAGQFAMLRGAAGVVGSAGSPEKVGWLRELGFTAAFDYHDGPVADLLAAAAPRGIDVYFDNVGGEHLEAAIGALRLHGRAAVCGSISTYNAVTPPPGPRNLSLLVASRLTLRGFLVSDHTDLRPEFSEAVSGWLRSGDLVVRETVREGLENAVPAFLDLLRGGNTGKMVVRLADA
jgi:NADPH-dependent curcumin reductase CurA